MAPFIVADGDRPKCPPTELGKEQVYVYDGKWVDIYDGNFFSVIKKEFRSFSVKWTQIKIPISSKLNQTQKSKYHIFSRLWVLAFKDLRRIIYTDGAEVEIKPGLECFHLTDVSRITWWRGVIYG